MPLHVTSFDLAVRAWILAHGNDGLHRTSSGLSTIGGVGPMRWAAVLLAIYLWARGRRAASISIVLAPFLALAAYAGTRHLVTRDRPPGAAALHEASSSFPSAHATTATAVCCTVAYVLWRERLLPGSAAIGLAILPPALVGLSRVFLDLHWATDVIGGWVSGIIIAGLAAVVHQKVATGRAS